jgi:uncharacterized protein (TIGR03083 family)
VVTDGSEPVIGSLDQVWASIVAACSGLTDEEWERATDCPGWTVRDQVAHLIGIESRLLGEPGPAPIDDPWPDHVRNDLGADNEAWIVVRRARAGDQVLAEFVSIVERRLGALRSLSPADFDAVGPSPIGPVPYRDFMVLRVFDCWVHEQDIRRALGRPGNVDGVGLAVTMERVRGAMGYVVGRRVGAPDGTSVAFVDRSTARPILSVGIRDGRGVVLTDDPAEPSVRLSLSEETFWRLGCGRIDPLDAHAQVEMEGDTVLGRAVLENMNFMI